MPTGIFMSACRNRRSILAAIFTLDRSRLSSGTSLSTSFFRNSGTSASRRLRSSSSEILFLTSAFSLRPAHRRKYPPTTARRTSAKTAMGIQIICGLPSRFPVREDLGPGGGSPPCGSCRGTSAGRRLPGTGR